MSGVLLIVCACIFAISQGSYAYGDEGFYVLAAQLITFGKRPYLDFFFQHPPLDIYFTAGWMSLFGDSWRSAHAFSAILTAASASMVGGFAFTRFSDRGWRLACAIGTVFLFASNVLVTRFGVIGQPYALSIFLIFSAFLLCVRATNHSRFSAIWAGLLSGIAFASSLLTAVIAPLLLVWIVGHASAPDRKRRFFQFVTGAVVGSLPLLWFVFRAPREVFFDLVTYHLHYRDRAQFWQGKNVLQEDLQIMTSWLGSAQGVLLALFTFFGIVAFFGASQRSNIRLRKELQLCSLIVICLSGYIGLARASCPQYFVLLVPFVAILAASGVYAVGTQMFATVRWIWPVLIILTLYGFEGAKSVRGQIRDPDTSWKEYEQIAGVINRVIPQACSIYSDDPGVYFAAKRVPPSGLENNYSFFLPRQAAEKVHVMSQDEADSHVLNASFGGVVTWSPKSIERLNLRQLYKSEEVFPGHTVFWQWANESQQPCHDR